MDLDTSWGEEAFEQEVRTLKMVQVSSSSIGRQVHSYQCVRPSCAQASAQAGSNAGLSCRPVLSRKTAAQPGQPFACKVDVCQVPSFNALCDHW